MKELLAGDEFYKAVEDLGLDAKRTYHGKWFEVWEISDESFDKLVNETEPNSGDFFNLTSNWKDGWGWWRYSEGSTIEYHSGYPTYTLTVNHQPMIGYFDISKYDDDMIAMSEDGETEEDDDDSWYFIHHCLTDYMLNEFGVSTETNVCAIATSIAKLNNIKLSELFEKYEGVEE